MPRKPKLPPPPKPIEEVKKTFVVKLDRHTITLLVSLASALGITGVGHLLNRGAVDETKAGSDIQVQDGWTKTRKAVMQLNEAVIALGNDLDETQKELQALKAEVSRSQRKPQFINTEEPTPPTPPARAKLGTILQDIESLPEALPAPDVAAIQKALKKE